MANQTGPYIPHNPGDLITAEDWNALQGKVQDDIAAKVKKAKEEIVESGVSRADNADHFAGRSDVDWTQTLDERYAPRMHDHEGQAVYQMIFKRFTTDTPSVFLHHNLGRFPLVEAHILYPLSQLPEDLSGNLTTLEQVKSSDEYPIRFFLYYHHEEVDKYGVRIQVYRERIPLGLPLAQILKQYQVKWQKDDTLQDVRNDLWAQIFAPPNDEISHGFSEWIDEQCIERAKIQQLIENDEWPDIRLAFFPVRTDLCCTPVPAAAPQDGLSGRPPAERPQGESDLESGAAFTGASVRLHMAHINYDVMVLEADLPENHPEPVDVMLLLRI